MINGAFKSSWEVHELRIIIPTLGAFKSIWTEQDGDLPFLLKLYKIFNSNIIFYSIHEKKIFAHTSSFIVSVFFVFFFTYVSLIQMLHPLCQHV